MAVQRVPLSSVIRIWRPSKFCRDDDLVADRLQRFAHEFLIRKRPVYLGRVEERDSTFGGALNHLDRLRFLNWRPKAEAEAHASKSYLRDLKATSSKLSRLHIPLRMC